MAENREVTSCGCFEVMQQFHPGTAKKRPNATTSHVNLDDSHNSMALCKPPAGLHQHSSSDHIYAYPSHLNFYKLVDGLIAGWMND